MKFSGRKKSNPNFVNGVPVLLVLRLLSRNEMYGYELVKAIQTSTRDALAFAEGCIYPILHSLEAEKLVKSREQAMNGRSRLYYSLTPQGRQCLEAMLAEWEKVSTGVNLALTWEPR